MRARIFGRKSRRRRISRDFHGTWRGAVEVLEERALLATFTVDTRFDIVDAGDGLTSLREAIAQANDEVAHPGHDTIDFDPSLKFAMIHADYQGFDAEGDPITGGAGGQFEITSDLAIDASSVGLVRIGHERGFAFRHRVFEISGASSPQVEMINVIVQGGDSNNFDGGGIWNAGELTLRNSVVGSNFAIGAGGGALKGGGIYNAAGGTLVLENTHVGEVLLNEAFLAGIGVDDAFYAIEEQRERERFETFVVRIPFELTDNGTDDPTRIGGNVSYGSGGGIYNDGVLEIKSGSVVDGNRASGNGVGIYNGATATIVDSTIMNHKVADIFPFSDRLGAGIYNTGTLSVERSVFEKNFGHHGGAIYNAGTLTVDKSLFIDNAAISPTFAPAAVAEGGAILDAGDGTLIANSTFTGSRATHGGAIVNRSNPNLVLDTVTISGNSADTGGGLYQGDAAATVVKNSTIAGNTATAAGGGVFSAGTTHFESTIIGDNSAGAAEDGPDVRIAAGAMALSAGFNLIESPLGHDLQTGGGGGTDIVGIDPRMGPLGDYGGPTPTHGLLPGSAAIDSSLTRDDLSGMTAEEIDALVDQRGEPRFVGPAADRGAFESRPPGNMRVDTLSGVADGFYPPRGFSLSEAVLWTNAIPGADSIAFTEEVLEQLEASEGESTTIDLPFELVITDDLTIHGPGADLLAISAHGAHRVMRVAANVTVTISGLTIRDGFLVETGRGAGILNEGNLTLEEVVLTENGAPQTDSEGGGIANLGTLSLIASTVHKNEAGLGGGLWNSATAIIVNSTLSANEALVRGGAVRNIGTLSVVSSTIAFNSAQAVGGLNAAGGTLNAANSIVALNSDESVSGDDDIGGMFNNQGNNLIGGNPLLGVLRNLGGPTPVHGLLPGSPAIDAVDPADAPTTDQRGVPRPVGSRADIGAFEFEPPVLANPIVVDTTSGVADGLFGPGTMSLTEAVLFVNDPTQTTLSEITFDLGLEPATITLEGGELVLSRDISIVGPSADRLTLDAGGLSRAFRIEAGVAASISGLTITGGVVGDSGGATLNSGELTLSEVYLSNNAVTNAQGRGGAVYNDGVLVVNRSTIAGGMAFQGGGVFNAVTGDVVFVNSTVTANRLDGAGSRGGGLFNAGEARFIFSTVARNSADEGGGIAGTGTLRLANTIVTGNTSAAGTSHDLGCQQFGVAA